MTMPRVFRAKYDGRCPACGEVIEKDEALMYDTDERVIHAECIDVKPRPRRAVEVCPRCFMEKAANGACECEEQP